MRINITVNGVKRTLDAPPSKRLLDLIRDDLHLKGAKEGCSQGECGACTVILNGRPVTSCLTLVSQIPDNSEILTIESQEPLLLEIKKAFVEKAAAQCGFCTPGMIMSSYALLKKNPKADIDEIKEGISGNLCRCTGYTKIYDAILLAKKRSSK